MNGSSTTTSLASILTSAIALIADATPTATISSLPISPTSTPLVPLPLDDPTVTMDPNLDLLCDWIRSAADCRDAEFVRILLITSSIMHALTFLFGLWLLLYRHGGFSRKIVSELFVRVGMGIRPKPMDCIVFFTGIACFVKVFANLQLIFDLFKDKLWLRIVIEQTYWVFVAIGFSSYFVGLLYAMPVSERDGIFAIYQPETSFDARPLPAIHVLMPTVAHRNFILVMGAVYPAVFTAGVGVASAVFAQMEGYEKLSKILLIIQYANWVLILWSMAIMFFYYGLKYTYILQANIIIAEAALKAPKAAFGISNLKSSSPARFLFVQLQITGFGGAAVTLLAGSLCMVWTVLRDQILRMEDDKLPHAIGFLWTCAISICFFGIMLLIAIQSIRNRRRGLHESLASQPSSKGLYSAPHQKTHTLSQSDSETHLTQLSSYTSVGKNSTAFEVTVESHDTLYPMDHNTFNAMHHANKTEQESTRDKNMSVGSPTRPFTIKSHNSDRRGSDASSAYGTKTQPDIRHTVFGSHPTKATSPSLSPTPYGSPSHTMIAMRPTSKVARGSKQKSDPKSSRPQVSDHTISQTDSSASHTLSAGSVSTTTYEDLITSTTTTNNQGGSLARGPTQDDAGHWAQQQQHQHQSPQRFEQPAHQNAEYQFPCKGLSPPPRAKRLPGTSKSTGDSVVLPASPTSPSSITSPSIGPVRHTFINNYAVESKGTVDSHYSAIPRVGGGVRRKSVKNGGDESYS
ncbi:hypothetical protein BG011_008682 [Mortierella polycephala]|uniref:Uncharacterized protein n=1 Tax=Mortierella polycephala TaxID=41804 RepID=A0A9P6U7Y1_9FUNG|nr:hypothetical protein BG011_008682 [Mortierella polycephala]